MSNLPKLTPENFTNRELSNIDFQRRILELAKDESVPLLERMKFIAIIGSNLDEFYMVRVGSYIQKHKLGIGSSRADGYKPNQLVQEIRHQVMSLMDEQRTVMRALFDALEKHNVKIVQINQLGTTYQKAIRAYFHEQVFPVLTPLAADHARPFPFISNLSLNIGVYLTRREAYVGEDDHTEFVRIKVPEPLPRLVNLHQLVRKYAHADDCHNNFVWIEDIISENLDLLFPGMEIQEHYPFRVTRNADIDYEHEQEAELLDISAIIEAGVKERRFGFVVRLSVPDSISPAMLDRLIEELDVDPDRDVYTIRGALGSADLFQLTDVDYPELKYPAHVPRIPEIFASKENIFNVIRQTDVLIHLPFDSFKPIEDFFWTAAHDPRVLAIKATLYRVGKNSPVVQALLEARENGKQVAVLVELKARFDEENNLEWARAMEEQGVHVTYGVEKLAVKTHAKIALVVRKEASGLKRYVHLGTGNYNASTARLYTDLGLFTCNNEIAEDATRLFNRLTGYAPATHYRRLLVAPEYLHSGLIELINGEIEAAKSGRAARLIFKMNQLEEDIIIQKLYEASQAGVQIDLIIRGLSCLKASIPGYSENIRVRSILGRFLEHPRIYYFHNASQECRIYAGSADLMRRNLYNRVEVVFPILDPRLQRRIERILVTNLKSTIHTWQLNPDDTYTPIPVNEGEIKLESQVAFIEDSFGLNTRIE